MVLTLHVGLQFLVDLACLLVDLACLLVDLACLLGDVEVTGDLLRKLLTHVHDGVLKTVQKGGGMRYTVHLIRKCPKWILSKIHRQTHTHLEEQLLCILGAVAEVGGAYLVSPTRMWVVESQQVSGMQQDGV